MKQIKIKCPAKINLTLEILNKRKDGFHNIQSVMQTIDLFDFLTIKIESNSKFEIKLTGTSDEIPYDEMNLAYRAVLLFKEAVKNKKQKAKCDGNSFYPLPFAFCSISVHIEKNIPISAGLAGGSTNAAGTLWGLNELFNKVLSKEELHNLCAKLGSDLNFCLEGGCQLATGRGEILEKLPYCEFGVTLIKPKTLGISAKEAYTKFSALGNKPNLNMTEKMIELLKSNSCDDKKIEELLHNDLEFAVFEDYKELQQIKKTYPKAIMSGSGSTYFVIGQTNLTTMNKEFWIKTELSSINYGILEAI